MSRNHANMAENGLRCTRRKQANPRRKNDTMGETVTDNNTPNLGPEEITRVSPSSTPDHTKKTSDESSQSATEDGPETTNSQLEEEQIKELIERGDTAIVFPEPVDRDLLQRSEDTTPKMDEYTLSCPYCEKNYPHVYALRQHMSTDHTTTHSTQFLCHKCETNFPSKSQLDQHLALHSPTQQSCKVCRKTFANVYRLQRHMISHDESQVLRKFKCPECGKAFKFKHHLKEHIRIHTGEKPFECPNCGKHFSHSGSYSSHMTSKKCLVMNLKVRGGQKPRGRKSEPPTLTPQGNAALQAVSTSHYNPFLTYKSFVSPRYTESALVSQLTAPVAASPLSLPAPEHLNPPVFPTSSEVVSSSSEKQAIATESSSSSTSTKQTDTSSKQTTDEVAIKTENNESEDRHGNNDLTAVKKILEVVNATVTKQKEQESALLARLRCGISPEVKLEKSAEEVKDELPQQPNGDVGDDSKDDLEGIDYKCGHCGEVFINRIDQHQHERYLCKMNKDVQLASIQSHHHIKQLLAEPEANGDSAATESEDGGSTYDVTDEQTAEETKNRMRSFINEEQVKILKAYYEINPRPRKFELIRIGQEVGFPKRVVQVWFQNMRARDRKRGRVIQIPFQPASAASSPAELQNSSVIKPTAISQHSVSSFTPVLSRYNGALVPSSTTAFQPLFYTSPVISPQFAHQSAHTKPVSSTPRLMLPFSQPIKSLNYLYQPPQDAPLDLSLKPKPAHNGGLGDKNEQEASSTPELHPELMAVLNLSRKNDTTTNGSMANKSIEQSILYQYMHREGMIKTGSPVDGISCRANFPSSPHSSTASTGCDSLHMVTPPPASISPASKSEASYDCMDENGNPEKDGSGKESCVTSDAEDCATEYDDEGRRIRKKTWKQMESEETEFEFDDSESPAVKRRKSWKEHKIESEGGDGLLYACDQCHKMFNKQSSLARHKYEHSGARPYKCDICDKAFKHKHHLTEHKRLHSGEKPFQCKKCMKRFSHSGSYSQHMNHRYSYCKPYRD